MSPFADYADFAACVKANSDKQDAKAYCATIMRKVEGEHAESVKGFKSPEPGKLAKSKRHKLAKIYAEVREKQKGNSPEEKERAAKIAWSQVKHGANERDVSQSPFMKDQREFVKERGEHPTLPEKTILQIVEDHKAKHGCKATMRKVAMHWKALRMAKHGSLAQIPDDYKKSLNGKSMATHSGIKRKKVQHARIPMDEYAEIDAQVMKEGEWPDVDGINRFYPWDVIAKCISTFKDREFYIDHPSNPHGTEMGVIVDTPVLERDGENWGCMKVRVPETEFTQAFLERVENGLIKEVSSVHDLEFNNSNPKRVTNFIGDSLGTVRTGAVDGARIFQIKRHIRSPTFKMKQLARAYKQVKNKEVM